MNINLDLKQLPDLLKAIQKVFLRYLPIIFIVLVLLIYSFLVWQIGTISNSEPNSDEISEQLKISPRLKIDQDVINKVEILQDQNIKIKSLFKEARDKPFQE